MLDVSQITVRRKIESGELRAVQLGGPGSSIRIPRQALERWPWGGEYMSARVDLTEFGYSRALWVPSPERWWLRPGGHGICTESEALRELAELVGGGGDEDDEAPRPAA